jgi:hypothetical protein
LAKIGQICQTLAKISAARFPDFAKPWQNQGKFAKPWQNASRRGGRAW